MIMLSNQNLFKYGIAVWHEIQIQTLAGNFLGTFQLILKYLEYKF